MLLEICLVLLSGMVGFFWGAYCWEVIRNEQRT